MLRLMAACAGALIAAGAGALAQPSLGERGGYLVNGVGVCGNCHSARGGDPKTLAGGTNVFNTPAYTVRGGNLTPDPETGIGKWSDADVIRALVEGKRPDGTQLAPNMPSNLFGVLTDRDRGAIVAYLRSIPAVKNPVPGPEYKAAFKVQVYPPASKAMTEADLSDPVKRGLYFASLGHCVACHSRPAPDGVDYGPNGFGAGGRTFGPKKILAANITSHKTKGIGSWTDAELKKMLVDGVSRDGRKLNPPMVEFAPYYKTMTDADLNAVITWMRSLPPLE